MKYFIVSIYTEVYNLFNYNEVVLENSIALFMSRFLPSNLHHVFHDDLLPLYFTLRYMCGQDLKCSPRTLLILLDSRNTDLLELYKLLVDEIFVSHKEENAKLRCFKTSYAGLNRLSVWYQYGYGKPQGPVDHQFNGDLLSLFTWSHTA